MIERRQDIAPALAEIYIEGSYCTLTSRGANCGNGVEVGFGKWGIIVKNDGTFYNWSGWYSWDKHGRILKNPACLFNGYEPSSRLYVAGYAKWGDDPSTFTGIGPLIFHQPHETLNPGRVHVRVYPVRSEPVPRITSRLQFAEEVRRLVARIEDARAIERELNKDD